MYDATFIESCFDNLVNSFNAHNSYEFLSSIYLTNTDPSYTLFKIEIRGVLL